MCRWLIGFLLVLRLVPAWAEPKVGDIAPDFALMGSDGKVHKLKEYRGQSAVVLAWFPKAGTTVCTQECKSLGETEKALNLYQVAVFAASCDSVETNRAFAEKLHLKYPILSDPERSAARAYGVADLTPFASRWTFYIGKDGKVLYIDKAINGNSAGQDVLDRLKALGIPKR